MKSTLVFALLLSLFCERSHASTSGGLDDFGGRIAANATAGINAQFLSFPLPMTNYLAGKYKIGFSGGYSEVQGVPMTLKGPEYSIALSYAWTDHWGIYVPMFYSDQNVSGGGTASLAHVGAGNPPYIFTGASGSVRHAGAGVALVWDPLADSPRGRSLPIALGAIFDQLKTNGLRTNYQSVSVAADTGHVTASSTIKKGYPLPFMSIEYGWNVGKYVKLIPSLFVGGGTIHSYNCVYGPPASIGNGCTYNDSGFAIFAPGLTVAYRPWGVSANLGASVYSALEHGNNPFSDTQSNKSAAFYNVSYAFGNYVK